MIISETTQAAPIDNNNSMTNSILLILTLVGIDLVLSHVKHWFPSVGHFTDRLPAPLFDKNGLKQQILDKERIDEEDILHAARELQGLSDEGKITSSIKPSPTGRRLGEGKANREVIFPSFLSSMDHIQYAVLESAGGITVIPKA